MPRVVVVGSVNIDLTVEVGGLPRPGETVLATGLRSSPGGKGANQAVACARQGVPTALVARIGDDGPADVLLAALAAEAIDLSRCRRVAGSPNGQALITVDAAGDNTIVVAPGANAELSPAAVREALAALATPSVVLAQLEIPVAAVIAALDAGRAAGATTILNPAPARSLPQELLDVCDVIVPNETEAAAVTGAATTTEALAAIAGRAPGATVIVTCGAHGALVRPAAGRVEHVPAVTVAAVDAVAAGDAFCGVLAASLAEGRGMDEAVLRATAAGAHAVTVAGALPSLPHAVDVDRLLAR